MTDRPLNTLKNTARWIAAGICLSVVALGWLGYRMFGEWQKSATALAQQRADEVANLLVLALTHDMYAVQKSVLSQVDWSAFMVDSPYDLSDAAASVFARYPYPESFLACRGPLSDEELLFVNRTDRPPHWSRATRTNRLPVAVERSPGVAHEIIARLKDPAVKRQKFVAFDMMIDGDPYELVVRLFYEDQFRDQLAGLFGFTVNLRWTRTHYVEEVARQVVRIRDLGRGATFRIIDRMNSDESSVRRERPVSTRSMSMAFFDPLLTFTHSSIRPWPPAIVLQVDGDADATFQSARGEAQRRALVAAVAILSLALGFVLTARAITARNDLVEMRSEFVSSITHELKTPIATISAAGASLAHPRTGVHVDARTYGRLVLHEAKRLMRLVDNLLAMSRITDITLAYFFEPVKLDEVVATALQDFSWLLESKQFETIVDVPKNLPPMYADRAALRLLLDNLIDNAVKHSTQVKRLHITASLSPPGIVFEVTDSGRGIPTEELPKVTRKFYRGRHAAAGGTGLGLAIVQHVVGAHGGTLTIQSEIEKGTTVSVGIPTVKVA